MTHVAPSGIVREEVDSPLNVTTGVLEDVLSTVKSFDGGELVKVRLDGVGHGHQELGTFVSGHVETPDGFPAGVTQSQRFGELHR